MIIPIKGLLWNIPTSHRSYTFWEYLILWLEVYENEKPQMPTIGVAAEPSHARHAALRAEGSNLAVWGVWELTCYSHVEPFLAGMRAQLPKPTLNPKPLGRIHQKYVDPFKSSHE